MKWEEDAQKWHLGSNSSNNGILAKTHRYKISLQETELLRKKQVLTACFQTSLSTFTLDLHTWGFILFNPQQLSFYLESWRFYILLSLDINTDLRQNTESVLRDPRGHCSSSESPYDDKTNQKKEDICPRVSREGPTCLLCSFGVSLAATSFNDLVRPRKLHRRVSGHSQRCFATSKHNKIMRKHFEKLSKRIVRLKKKKAINLSSHLWFSC